MKKLRKITAIFLAICIIASFTTAFANDRPTIQVPVAGKENYTKSYEVLDLVNKARLAENENEESDAKPKALKMDGELLELAMQRAAECAFFFEDFGHERPNGEDWDSILPKRFDDTFTCEFVAMGDSTSAEIADYWLDPWNDGEYVLYDEFASVGIACFEISGTSVWVMIISSVAPNEITKPANKDATHNIPNDYEHFRFVWDVVEGEQPNTAQLVFYQYNEYFDLLIPIPKGFIAFESTHPDVFTISETGLVTKLGVGWTDILFHFGIDTLGGEISTPELGNVNNDWEISNADLVALARHIVGFDDEICEITSDMDMDGNITNTDLIALARRIVGLTSQTEEEIEAFTNVLNSNIVEVVELMMA